MSRPSVYLKEKVATLDKVLNFFSSNEGGTKFSLKEKKLVFLAQIDFWDWEMDTLIFSFENFKERSKVWTDGKTLEQLLLNEKFLIKYNVLEEVKYKQGWSFNRTEVVAPIEDINRLIYRWNLLLMSCENSVFRDDLEEMNKLNADFLLNLDKFRKNKVE